MTDRPNTQAVRAALDIFIDEMNPFMARCLRQVRRGGNLDFNIRNALRGNQLADFDRNRANGNSSQDSLDIGAYPHFIQTYWGDVFQAEFRGDRSIESSLRLIRKARNSVSHVKTQQDMDPEYARMALFLIADVMGKIGKPERKLDIEKIRTGLFATHTPSQQDANARQSGLDPQPAPQTPAAQTTSPRNGAGSSTPLRPWREVISPNPDLGTTIIQSEFAADLQRVHDGRATSDYGDCLEFFERTHITPGMRTLLVNTLKRVSGKGGDPVIQTKTDFGGGKTHSLIALYHLIKNGQSLINPPVNAPFEIQDAANAIRGILREAGIDPNNWTEEPKAAVLDCSHLSETDTHQTAAGDPLNTLWGEMAYQLAGQDGYDLLRESIAQASAPGGKQLDDLFELTGPCLILVDELTGYFRNVKSAGSPMAPRVYTFLQNLTASVAKNPTAALVITLPSNQIEAGGEEGAEALQQIQSTLEHYIGRIEAVWQPLEVHEAFEVVRRRLFGPVKDEAERDRACQSFYSRYTHNRRDFPDHSYEQRYLERMKECYPIHPEVFDRLHNDWGSNPRFQRTRGVLRLLASCISRMLLEEDNSPMIMPGNIPLNDAQVRDVFQRLLPSQSWGPTLHEVDSENSRVVDIDKRRQDSTRSGGAARRIARAVFLGSSATGAIQGITAQEINLGVIQPGQSASTYADALNQMRERLYFFYADNGRYYFHSEENLNKVASDRMADLDQEEIYADIVATLKTALGIHSGAIICPADSSQIPDDPNQARLVIMPPSKYIGSRSDQTDITESAHKAMRDMLLHRGDAQRINRNNLVFLVAKSDDIRALNATTRACIAWKSINSGASEVPNLTGERKSNAVKNLKTAEQNQISALARAYRQAVSPSQPDPLTAYFNLDTGYTTSPNRDSAARDIAQSAMDKLKEQECLADRLSPNALSNLLNGKGLWRNATHIDIDALWGLIAQNVHLDIRLSDKSVLRECVRQGVRDGAFGYAEGIADNGQYINLRYAEYTPLSIGGHTPGLLVKPDIATRQKDAETPQEAAVSETGSPTTRTIAATTEEIEGNTLVGALPPAPTSMTISARISDDISMDKLADIHHEIIRAAKENGANVSVTISIDIDSQGGLSENATRALRENASQLGMESRVK